MKKVLLSLILAGITSSVLFSLGSGTVLAQEKAKSEEPTISYAMKMEITFTGILYSSTDGVTWTKVEGATSPYLVSFEDAKKMLFCSKEEEQPAKPLKPGENGTVSLSDTVNLEMVWIEPGTFMMGSPSGEPFKGYNETQHEVTLTKGYWLGKYELTQEQYTAITQKEIQPFTKFPGTNAAVGYINRYEALSICAKLNEMERAAGRLPEGYEYTLPTEAQWEYACRAGTTTGLNSGKEVTCEMGICPNLDEVGWYSGNAQFIQPVGQKVPNAWGLYDMHGNVGEWCLDWYGEYPKTPVVDPTGPEEGVDGILRGCFFNVVSYCRSASRIHTHPSSTSTDSGLRVALVPIQ